MKIERRFTKPGQDVAPGIGSPPQIGDVEDDGTSGAMKGELASELSLLTGPLLQLGALERESGILLDVKEVGAAQVLVALRLIGIDAGCLDGALHYQLLGILGVEVDHAFEAVETPLHARKEVADAEADVGMRGVDLPLLGAGLSRAADE